MTAPKKSMKSMPSVLVLEVLGFDCIDLECRVKLILMPFLLKCENMEMAEICMEGDGVVIW